MYFKPDQLYLQAQTLVDTDEKSAQASKDELVQVLLQIRRGEPIIDNALTRALEIYQERRQSKLILEALLLAPDSSVERICDGMGLKKETVGFYKKYFFDTSIFRDKLDITDYISELKDPNDWATKTMAVNHGFYFVLSNFSGEGLNLSPLQVCKNMQAMAYRMTMQARSVAITSEAAKEAKSWAGIVKVYTDSIAKLQPVDAQSEFLSDFRITFEKEDGVSDIGLLEGSVIRG